MEHDVSRFEKHSLENGSVFLRLVYPVHQPVSHAFENYRKGSYIDVTHLRFSCAKWRKHVFQLRSRFAAGDIPTLNVEPSDSHVAPYMVAVGVKQMQNANPSLDAAPLIALLWKTIAIGDCTADKR